MGKSGKISGKNTRQNIDSFAVFGRKRVSAYNTCFAATITRILLFKVTVTIPSNFEPFVMISAIANLQGLQYTFLGLLPPVCETLERWVVKWATVSSYQIESFPIKNSAARLDPWEAFVSSGLLILLNTSFFFSLIFMDFGFRGVMSPTCLKY